MRRTLFKGFLLRLRSMGMDFHSISNQSCLLKLVYSSIKNRLNSVTKKGKTTIEQGDLLYWLKPQNRLTYPIFEGKDEQSCKKIQKLESSNLDNILDELNTFDVSKHKGIVQKQKLENLEIDLFTFDLTNQSFQDVLKVVNERESNKTIDITNRLLLKPIEINIDLLKELIEKYQKKVRKLIKISVQNLLDYCNSLPHISQSKSSITKVRISK